MQLQNKYPYFILLFFWFICLGCPEQYNSNPDSTIKIINKDSADILYYFYFNHFPDTTFNPLHGSPFEDIGQYNIAVLQAEDSTMVDNLWLKWFEADSTPVMLFLFSRDTIDKVPWEKIIDEYNILKRYDLGKAELDSLNWTITYP